MAWSVLGFLFFRSILHRDKQKRFGSSSIVWFSLLALVLFVALIWMRQSMIGTDETMLESIQDYYAQKSGTSGSSNVDERYIENLIAEAEHEDTRTILMAVGMFGFSLLIMLTNHSYMNRRAKESEAIASIDPMTGVKNKHEYIMNEKNMNTAITDGSAQEFSLVVCDVNGLKKINDTLGHKAGDDYIREACRLVCGTFKHSPVYRIGGDEFAVILTGHDYTSREGLVQELHDQSVANIGMGGAVISAGSSDYRPGQDKVLQDVFDRADKKMYEEKQALKNLGAVTRD